jgi:hypothetical protein
VLTVVVELMFLSTGCASLANTLANMFYQGAETEQSKKFLDGANDILTQNPDGYPALQFKARFNLRLCLRGSLPA